ncbi:MAG: hypothetical protein ACOC1H_02050, partial [Desulfosalsimonas sp.]
VQVPKGSQKTDDAKEKAGTAVSGHETGSGPADRDNEPAVDRNPNLPPEVVELARLLRRTPISVVTRPNRVFLNYPENWAGRNWETLGKISDMVYRNDTVWEHIRRLPAGKYAGANLANV